MFPAQFEYHAPRTLRQAVALLQRYGEEAKVLAGGQSLIPLMRFRLVRPAHLVDLGRVEGLSGIRAVRGAIVIGAMTTHWEVESSPLLQERVPVLPECARQIADMQVRNRGTVGGSLAHADPAADYPAVLLALGARLRTAGPRGMRTLAIGDFFQGPYTTALEPGEVLTEVRIPEPPARSGASYRKFANPASHFAIVGVCAFVALTARGTVREVRIGVTGACPTPFRAEAAEAVLRGQRPTERNLRRCAERVPEGREGEMNEDLYGSGEYRAHLCRVMALEALEEAVRRAGG